VVACSYTPKVKIRPSITKLLRSDGTVTCSDSEMATLLNNYSSTAFTSEDIASIPATGSTPTKSILGSRSIQLRKALSMH